MTLRKSVLLSRFFLSVSGKSIILPPVNPHRLFAGCAMDDEGQIYAKKIEARNEEVEDCRILLLGIFSQLTQLPSVVGELSENSDIDRIHFNLFRWVGQISEAFEALENTPIQLPATRWGGWLFKDEGLHERYENVLDLVRKEIRKDAIEGAIERIVDRAEVPCGPVKALLVMGQELQKTFNKYPELQVYKKPRWFFGQAARNLLNTVKGGGLFVFFGGESEYATKGKHRLEMPSSLLAHNELSKGIDTLRTTLDRFEDRLPAWCQFLHQPLNKEDRPLRMRNWAQNKLDWPHGKLELSIV